MAVKKVGELIKEARTNAGLSQDALAKLIDGVSGSDSFKHCACKRSDIGTPAAVNGRDVLLRCFSHLHADQIIQNSFFSTPVECGKSRAQCVLPQNITAANGINKIAVATYVMDLSAYACEQAERSIT